MTDHEITLYPSRFGGFMVVCSCGKDLLEEGTQQVLLDELNRMAHEHIEDAEGGSVTVMCSTTLPGPSSAPWIRALDCTLPEGHRDNPPETKGLAPGVRVHHDHEGFWWSEPSPAYGAESAVTSEDDLINLDLRIAPRRASD